jgi:hypothetical protein
MRRDSESGRLTNAFAVRMGKLDIPMPDRFLHIGSWSFLDLDRAGPIPMR